MSDQKVNILHLSDLHIVAESMDFHSELHQYLKTHFENKEIDFLVLSGDLGDKCSMENVEAARKWIDGLKKELGLRNDQVILCAGNHDIDIEKLSASHHEMCHNYGVGKKYIKEGYPIDAFERYNRILADNKPEDARTLRNGDMIIERENVRFIVLNSSWLSQINGVKRKELQEELGRLVEQGTMLERTKEIFCNVVCMCDIPNDSSVKNVFSWSFNHSENMRQQIDDAFIENVEKDDKLTVVVFHHPEFCLHFLDHFALPGFSGSGVYHKLSGISDVLLCGHIHPIGHNHEDSLGLYQLIGGACHETNANKNHDLRPLFYFYSFTKNQEKAEIVNLATNYYYRELTSSSIKFTTVDSKIQPKRRRASIMEPLSKPVSSAVAKEEHFPQLTDEFATWFKGSFENYLSENHISCASSKKNIFIPNTSAPQFSYHIRSTMYQFCVDNKFYVHLDFFSSTNLLYQPYLKCRIDKYRNPDILRAEGIVPAEIPNEHIFYAPIILDVLYSLIDSEACRKDYQLHNQEALKRYVQTLENEQLPKLITFLGINIPGLKTVLPKFLNANGIVFVQDKIINDILNKIEIPPKNINYSIEDGFFDRI